MITVVFVVLRRLRPVDRAVRLRPVHGADGVQFPKLARTGGDHLFGTNDLFFDVLLPGDLGRADGARGGACCRSLLSSVIGVLLGLVSGYVGGWLDRVLVLVMDALYAFPSFLLAIVFSFLLQRHGSAAA